MKKLMLLLLIIGSITGMQAQRVTREDMPVAIKVSFGKAHPAIRHETWRRDGDEYEAAYNSRKINRYATYNASGKSVRNGVQIRRSALPVRASNYMDRNYKGYKMERAYRVTHANGRVTYLTTIKGRNLKFDAEGNFMK